MAKYHIKVDGTPGVCRATKNPCPLGGQESHFSSKEDAQREADRRNETKYGLSGANKWEKFYKKGDELGERFDKLDPETKEIYKDIQREMGEELTSGEFGWYSRFGLDEFHKNERKFKEKNSASYEKMKNIIDEYEKLNNQIVSENLENPLTELTNEEKYLAKVFLTTEGEPGIYSRLRLGPEFGNRPFRDTWIPDEATDGGRASGILSDDERVIDYESTFSRHDRYVLNTENVDKDKRNLVSRLANKEEYTPSRYAIFNEKTKEYRHLDNNDVQLLCALESVTNEGRVKEYARAHGRSIEEQKEHTINHVEYPRGDEILNRTNFYLLERNQRQHNFEMREFAREQESMK